MTAFRAQLRRIGQEIREQKNARSSLLSVLEARCEWLEDDLTQRLRVNADLDHKAKPWKSGDGEFFEAPDDEEEFDIDDE